MRKIAFEGVFTCNELFFLVSPLVKLSIESETGPAEILTKIVVISVMLKR
jgi:hypothetical protein